MPAIAGTNATSTTNAVSAVNGSGNADDPALKALQYIETLLVDAQSGSLTQTDVETRWRDSANDGLAIMNSDDQALKTSYFDALIGIGELYPYAAPASEVLSPTSPFDPKIYLGLSALLQKRMRAERAGDDSAALSCTGELARMFPRTATGSAAAQRIAELAAKGNPQALDILAGWFTQATRQIASEAQARRLIGAAPVTVVNSTPAPAGMSPIAAFEASRTSNT